MNKLIYTAIAISRASSIIQYASWAQQEEDPAKRIEWITEAINSCKQCKEWLEKELPF